MTQLDIPTISFTHYLDLLKRRTWHVSVVSVLGLIVGGVVAMLIPRYYVANTTIELVRPVLDPNRGTPRDLMSQVVNAAMLTVPRGVDKAVRELGWHEAVSGSANDRRAFITEVKARVKVYDLGPDNPNRRLANLLIRYSDLRGDRAAAMANKLRDIWLKDVLDKLKSDAEREIDLVVQRRTNLLARKRDAETALKLFEQEFGIDPLAFSVQPGGEQSQISRDIRAIRTEIGAAQLKIKSLERSIRIDKTELDGTPETKKLGFADLVADPAMKAEYFRLVTSASYTQQALQNYKPAHPRYATIRKTLDGFQSRLAELQKLAGDQARDVPNPAYQVLDKGIRDQEQEKLDKEAEVLELEARLAELQDRFAKLPEINRNYRRLRDDLENQRIEEKSLLAELAEKNRAMESVQKDRPYGELVPAYIPPAPTDPNPYLLAGIGCAVGLALAIALVLLFDFLQMSFKSVADVESGLGLPVLGTMSYLETEVESGASRGRRRFTAVFAVTFLVLLLTVVTIYYVDPTALPEAVSDILDLILGKPR